MEIEDLLQHADAHDAFHPLRL
jgi:hypothetical protein